MVLPQTPTSYKAAQDSKLVSTVNVEVTIPAPFSPKFLPHSPLILALIKGINNISKYIFVYFFTHPSLRGGGRYLALLP